MSNYCKCYIQSDAAIKKETGKETYTKAEVEAIEAKDESMQQFKGFILQMFSYADSISEIENDLKDGIKHFAGQLNYNLNLEYNGRKILGDNENDLSDAPHGNNNVIGPRFGAIFTRYSRGRYHCSTTK